MIAIVSVLSVVVRSCILFYVIVSDARLFYFMFCSTMLFYFLFFYVMSCPCMFVVLFSGIFFVLLVSFRFVYPLFFYVSAVSVISCPFLLGPARFGYFVFVIVLLFSVILCSAMPVFVSFSVLWFPFSVLCSCLSVRFVSCRLCYFMLSYLPLVTAVLV